MFVTCFLSLALLSCFNDLFCPSAHIIRYLGPHAKRKREGEDIIIIVAGCVAQQEGQSLLRRIPEIDLGKFNTQVLQDQIICITWPTL